MSTTFFGRTKELAEIRKLWDECVERDVAGKFIGGPRMALIIAETGLGKSRLVQEFYLRLTNDPVWDPPEVNYWPDAFRDIGAQIRVTPDMADHLPKGPPRFAWLGVRWTPPDARNPVARNNALPEIRETLGIHAEIARQQKSTWQDAWSRMKKGIKDEVASEVFGYIADKVIPFSGPMLKLAKGAKHLITDRFTGPKSFTKVEGEQAKDITDELLEYMQQLLSGSAAIPVVLWLDDAQWIDGETLRFLHRLWSQAEQHHWPLLVLATHWEREWKELKAAPASTHWNDLSLSLYEGRSGVHICLFKEAEEADLLCYLKNFLPGLTAAQQKLLIDKASGNFLTMIENVGELVKYPGNFVDNNTCLALAPVGEKKANSWESERQRRVGQRFGELEAELKELLGWSSYIGVRFLHEVVTDFGVRVKSLRDGEKLIERCVDPYVILGKPSVYTREFRDKAFHIAAAKYFSDYGTGDEEQLSLVLREHLVEWVNNSFNEHGGLLNSSDNPPERSMARLLHSGQTGELRDLLMLALRELPLKPKPNWENSASMAAVRALWLATHTDALDNLWGQVRSNVLLLKNIEWNNLPEGVLSFSSRVALAKRAETAGALIVALSILEEHLSYCNTRVQELGTPESRRDLGMAFRNLAEIKAAQGDLPTALLKGKKGLDISRALAQEIGTPESHRDLSVTLQTVASIEEAQGNLPAALLNYQENLDIAKVLAQELDTPESRRDLSASLNWVAQIEQVQENLPAALLKHQKCLDISRALVKEVNTPKSRQDLSKALLAFASIEEAQKNLPTALLKYQESLDIADTLAQEIGTPENRRLVSVVLYNVANIEKKQGDLPTALLKYKKCIDIFRALAQELGTPGSQRDLCVTLGKVADIEEKQGDLPAALLKNQESLNISRALAQALNTHGSRQNLREVLIAVADIENKQGHHTAALLKYQESLDIARALVKEVDTPKNRRGLGRALYKVAGFVKSPKDFSAALLKYQESLDIFRALVKELNTLESRLDLSFALNEAAGIEEALHNLPAALLKCQESLDISRALVKELNTPESRRELSVSLNQVALIEEKQKNLPAALLKYQECLDIADTLAQELGTPESRRDMSIFLYNVGNIEKKQGDIPTALLKYKKCIDIFRALAQELGTPGSLRDLRVFLNKVAGVEKEHSDIQSALTKYQEGFDIADTLAQKLDTPQSHWDLSESLDNLAGLYDYQGQYALAEPLYKRSLAIKEKDLGPYHPVVVASLENIAALYKKSGREKEAEELEKRIAIIREGGCAGIVFSRRGGT